MADRAKVLADAQALAGKRTGLSYHDLARALQRAECYQVGSSGSHRTWKSDVLSAHLTLVDKGSRDVLPVYIQKTRKYLLSIAEQL